MSQCTPDTTTTITIINNSYSSTVRHSKKEVNIVQAQWLTPINPAVWEAENRRLSVQGHPGQKIRKTLYQRIR
jgi:hypothetical protein